MVKSMCPSLVNVGTTGRRSHAFAWILVKTDWSQAHTPPRLWVIDGHREPASTGEIGDLVLLSYRGKTERIYGIVKAGEAALRTGFQWSRAE